METFHFKYTGTLSFQCHCPCMQVAEASYLCIAITTYIPCMYVILRPITLIPYCSFYNGATQLLLAFQYSYQLSYLLQSFRSTRDISFTMFLPHQHDYIAIAEKLGWSTARAKRLQLHAKLVRLFSTFYTTILFSEVPVSPHQLVNLFNLGRLLTFN